MKRKSRKGSGQGPESSRSKASSQDSRQRKNDGKGAKSSRPGSGGGADSRDERGSDSKPSARGAQEGSRSRRVIKNARGLRDVLGLGDGGAKGGAARGGQRPARGQAFDQAEARERDDAAKESLKSSGGPKKLQYIMNFQPPAEEPRAETPARKSSGPPPVPAKTQPSAAPIRRAATQAAPQVQSQTPAAQKNRADRPPERKRRDERPERPERGGHRFDKRSGKRDEQPEEVTPSKAGTPDRLTGIVKRHPDGFGFLIPDDTSQPDVYISRQSMSGVMTNDRVEVQIYRSKGKPGQREDRLAGEIKKVLAHSNKNIVGKYLPVDQKYGVILDAGRGWGADLRITAKDSMNAKEGDLVAVEILSYPGDNQEFTGKVVDLIGSLEDPMNDVIRVIHTAGIPHEFSGQVIAEAKRFGDHVTEEEIEGREDIRHFPMITIDGVTAKDFDDAVWTQQTETGFQLIVAIADVSHYVKPGTKLDEEAYERGTSTYFPNFVVPMLPEQLSNELCSLKPEVARLCFCCEMSLDFSGVVQEYRFFEAVMESQARVTYGEAQEVLDGKENERFSAEVETNIRTCADLAKILMQKRMREGSLDLEIPETQVVVDATGESTDIIRSQRLFAHRLIEELMLVTNICTAKFMDDHEIPGIYRIHEEPDPDNIKALQRYLWNLGGSKSVMGEGLAKKLTKALQAMEGRPESQVLNILTLRTMRQAQYSENNVGHFGLGFPHYSHFTSPIRRYPDLIAHRLIKSQLYPKYRSMQMDESELATATSFLSGCEQRSVKAERQVISIKKARFIRGFLGEEFDGSISSVAKFGVFVLLRQYDVDGLVKIENLGGDRFIFDDENLRLIGPKTGIRYTIGDTLRVRVASADVETGKVDFELANPPEVAPGDEDDEIDEDFFGAKTDRESGGRPQKGQRNGANQGNQKRNGEGSRSAGAAKKGKRVDPQKRGTTENNSGRVRKERVSKRRRKN